MRATVLAVLAMAGLLAACAPADIPIENDRQAGHFGAGTHAGRVDGG